VNRFRVDDVFNNQDLRIRYLRNLIDENEFKSILQKNDKKNSKKRDIYLVYIMFINTTTDILYRFCDVITNMNLMNIDEEGVMDLMNILDEIKHIVKYSNECLQDIENTYKCKINKIVCDEIWESSYNYNVPS
jgi:hypothetical protein